MIHLVAANPPVLAISTASAAVAGTGSFDRFFHHITAFCRANLRKCGTIRVSMTCVILGVDLMSDAATTNAIKEILKQTELSRDALPYSEEFERHYAAFTKAIGIVTRQQFWRLLSNAAKRGGWKGKKRGEPAPALTHQQADSLRQLLAGRLGGRDSLPYSPDFDAIRQQFNKATGLPLEDRPFWRAVCSVCKHPLRPDLERLLTQAIDSLTNGVDYFNRSSDRGRQASVLILLQHACEMLLKAGLLQRDCDIRDRATGYTLSFDNCLNRATDDGNLQFLSYDERATLRVLNNLRDQAQHYLVDVSEQVLYTVSQSALTLFGKLVSRLFGISLSERLPRRVLPLSTDPPTSIHMVMDEEFTQLKRLLNDAARVHNKLQVEAKLRCLLAMDRAIDGKQSNVSTQDFDEARQRVAQAAAWDEVFKGIARLQMTSDGSGVGVALTIQKQGGIPVRIVCDGEDPSATVAVRKVNNTDFYCFGADELGKRLKLDRHKTLALIWKLGLQREADCFSEITIGKMKYKRYSQNALTRLRDAIPRLDLEAICREYSARPRKQK